MLKKKESVVMRMERIGTYIEEMNTEEICANIIDYAIDMLMQDSEAEKRLFIEISKRPILIKEAIYWNKFKMFVEGVKKIEDDLEQGVRLSSKLFDDPKNRKQNGMRLLGYVDRADSEQKITYYINSTRSLLMGNINNTEYFRIMRAISETMSEDLECLAENATTSEVVKGNIQILALERSGLVLQAGFDANESIETQEYLVSDLGKWWIDMQFL